MMADKQTYAPGSHPDLPPPQAPLVFWDGYAPIYFHLLAIRY